MARFSIEKWGSFTWLHKHDSLGRCASLDRAGADEIRQLLDEAFPVEQQPATDDTDPDEVRRALGRYESGVMYDKVGLEHLIAAARAWLRMREQQPATENVTRDPDVTDVVAPSSSLGFDAQDWAREFRRVAKKLGYSDMDEGWLVAWFANAIMRGFDEHAKQQPEPGPTIAQVIEACGATEVSVHRAGDKWCAQAGPLVRSAYGPSAETAIRALYDDAIAKLKQQRDEAEQKLAQLGTV